MSSCTCPNCGHKMDVAGSDAASNTQRMLNLAVPEQHWPIFKMMFTQMNTRFGMMGMGEFANVLPGYADKIPFDRDIYRYFDDKALAYVYLGMEMGYQLKTRIEEGGSTDYEGNKRMKVFGDLISIEDDRKPITVTLSGGVLETMARQVCTELEEASARLTPMRDS